jgi:hypothetical protein
VLGSVKCSDNVGEIFQVEAAPLFVLRRGIRTGMSEDRTRAPKDPAYFPCLRSQRRPNVYVGSLLHTLFALRKREPPLPRVTERPKTHRSHILQKLNLHNSAEIALAAPGFYFSSKRAPPKAPGV